MTQYEKGYKFGYAQALQDLETVFNECLRKIDMGETDDND